MKPKRTPGIIDWTLGLVWLVMGLYCKILGLVPRHEAIIGEIFNTDASAYLTILIGLGECLLAFWIASGCYRKTSAVIQIILVIAMNLIEFTLAMDHLLWGPLNMLFALLFCSLVYWNAYILNAKTDVEQN